MTQGLSRTSALLATLGVAMALLLAALDQTVVGVAMPRIVSELHGLQYYAWVTTAYLITSTALVPVAGKLGDMFGRKPFLLAGMVGFIAASALCGTSFNMASLVAFRALQGVFGGVLFASTFAVLADLFPPEQRARMSGVFGAVFGLSSVIGPTLGGYLTDGPGWRWGFYVIVPLLYQGVLGVSAPNAGQLLTPMMLAVVVTSPATGALIARMSGYRWLGTASLAVMVLGLVLLARVAVGSSALEVTRDIVIIGAGLGVTFPLTFVVIQAGLPHRLIGVGTSQLTFWRSLGGTIGTAVLGSILVNRLPMPPSRMGLAVTLHDMFLVAAAGAAVAVIVRVFLRQGPLTRPAGGPPGAPADEPGAATLSAPPVPMGPARGARGPLDTPSVVVPPQ